MECIFCIQMAICHQRLDESHLLQCCWAPPEGGAGFAAAPATPLATSKAESFASRCVSGTEACSMLAVQEFKGDTRRSSVSWGSLRIAGVMWQDMEHAGRGPPASPAGQSPEDSHQPGSRALGWACSNVRSPAHLWLVGRPCQGTFPGFLDPCGLLCLSLTQRLLRQSSLAC